MNNIFKTILAAGLFFTLGSNAWSFSSSEKAQIESIVADYLVAHPEVIVKAMRRLEEQEHERTLNAAQEISKKLRTSKDHYMLGKSNAKHVIVEFFDYNCGYCKVMEPMFKKALNDYDLQIIYVNIPVISEESKQLSIVSQALFDLDKKKFEEFHNHFMKPGRADGSIEGLKAYLKSIDVDFDKIVKIMQSQKPQNIIGTNMSWANELKLAGTPYLIIDGNEFRGAITSEDILQKILEG